MFFDREAVTVMIGNTANRIQLGYSEVSSLQFAGRGALVTTSGGGWIGGGFGPAGILAGVALGSTLNALTTTRRQSIETIVHLNWDSGSVTLLNQTLLPEAWAALMAPVVRRIEEHHKPALESEAPNASIADVKVCPFCAETIKAAAIKCRYCGSDVSAVERGMD